MKRLFKRFACLLTGFMIIMGSLIPAAGVWAAEATITLNTEGEYCNSDEDVVLNVHLNSQEKIGKFYIEIDYDDEKLIYLSGADKGTDGTIVLSGTGFSDNVDYEVTFRANKAGEAGFVVSRAEIFTSKVNGEQSINVTENSFFLQTINVVGMDEGDDIFTARVAAQKEILSLNRAVSGVIEDENGGIYYVADLSKEQVEGLNFPYELKEGKIDDIPITFAVDENRVLQIVALIDRSGKISLYSLNGNTLYRLTDYVDQKGTHYLCSTVSGCISLPAQFAGDKELQKRAVYMVADGGECGFYLFNETGEPESWLNVNRNLNGRSHSFWEMIHQNDTGAVPWERYLVTAGLVTLGLILLFIIAAVIAGIRRSVRRKKYKNSKNKPGRSKQTGEERDRTKKREAVKQPEKSENKAPLSADDVGRAKRDGQNKPVIADFEEVYARMQNSSKEQSEQENQGDFEFINGDLAFDEIEDELLLEIEDLTFEKAEQEIEASETLPEKTIVLSSLPIRSKGRNRVDKTEESEKAEIAEEIK